jgi:FkbM family methyltransferase
MYMNSYIRYFFDFIRDGFGLLYKKFIKYRGYNSAGYGLAIKEFAEWVKSNTSIEIKNIFEIGANFGQDADALMEAFKLQPNDVYVFEAHPEIYDAITKIHKFNAYNYAVFNEEKDMSFNIAPLKTANNTGISSVFKLPDSVGTKNVEIKSIRMDNFMEKNNISTVDFLKLDVEGASYEVLEGFGERLKDVKVMHIEAEHGEFVFGGSDKYFDDISKLLKDNGFEMVYFKRNWMQSDSFWVKKELYSQNFGEYYRFIL